jgi:RNA polymerase sigma factor (sigma-70 family)
MPPGPEPAAKPQDEGNRLESLLVESLPIVEQAVRVVSQRNHLRPADAEDLASEVKLALMAHDYRALRQFEGRSSLKTYLVTLVQRTLIDRQRRVTGKWRPSAQAERLGPVAVRLELLIRRDHVSLSEAISRLREELAVTETDDELAAMAERIPPRFRARPIADGDAAATAVPAGASADPEMAVASERLGRALCTRLAETLRALDPEDRLILRMRFERDMTIADVARGLGLDPKSVYRRVDRLLARARGQLKLHGLTWEDAEQSIQHGHCDLRFAAIFGESGETRGSDPSTPEVGA